MMNYPNNRLIVNGVDLTEKFRMILLDGYVLTPPTPKTYIVDIPGGNGKLDLTETLLGDTAYDNRKQEFSFYIIDTKNVEKIKTEISNFLHGKSFYYQLTMDQEYTYHGRFAVSEFKHSSYSNGIVAQIKITIDADPFKMKPTQVCKINAVGGAIVELQSGRMRSRPVIESDGLVRVIFDNKLLILPQGTWTINDLLFTEGMNELYLNSYEIHNLTWGDLNTNSVTWGEFKNNRLYEWYKSNGDGTFVNKTWNYLLNDTWGDIDDQTWVSQLYEGETTDVIKDVYVKYDWGDL